MSPVNGALSATRCNWEDQRSKITSKCSPFHINYLGSNKVKQPLPLALSVHSVEKHGSLAGSSSTPDINIRYSHQTLRYSIQYYKWYYTFILEYWNSSLGLINGSRRAKILRSYCGYRYHIGYRPILDILYHFFNIYFWCFYAFN